ncbi:uncharacterized protein LOC111350893 [Spodoptera litura]|uniref:Uncharacterized protein LOC111350893 n=1 Tax=Spodoptera litura TaxID=69820 RepID=A0A9J7DXD8_SPOLT|nr:uncharacterized protein LOC111350893 [Spodoptera litura]
MRSFIIITVLSALAACYGVAVPPSEEVYGGYTLLFDDISPEGRIVSSAELNAGSDRWVKLSESILDVPAVPGHVQRIGTKYEGDASVVITRWSVTSDVPTASYSFSPFGSNLMEVTIQSHLGNRIYSTVTIYGVILNK